MRRKGLIILVTWVAIAVSGSGAVGQTARAPAQTRSVPSDVPAEFQPLYARGPVDTSTFLASLPYDSIQLEREDAAGISGPRRPEYHLILRRDGSAELHVNQTAPRPYGLTGTGGEFSGKVAYEDYGRLCYLAKQLGIEGLGASYGPFHDNEIHHGATTLVRLLATAADGTKSHKVIAERDAGGPIALWAFEQAIDGVAQTIQWTFRSSTRRASK